MSRIFQITIDDIASVNTFTDKTKLIDGLIRLKDAGFNANFLIIDL